MTELTNTAGEPWPVYYADALHVSNPDSCTAIISLWTKKEHLVDVLDPDSYAFLGQMYSQAYGLEVLVRNLLANNAIRHLVLTGIDLNDVSPVVKNFFEQGVGQDGYVVDTDVQVSDDVRHHADTLRNRIEFHDKEMSNGFEELNQYLYDLPFLEPQGPEHTLELPENKAPTKYPNDHATHKVRGRDFEEAWHTVLDKAMTFGQFKPDEKRLVLLNVAVHVSEERPGDAEHIHGRINTYEKRVLDGETYKTKQFKTLDAWNELPQKLPLEAHNTTLFVNELYIPEPDLEEAFKTVKKPSVNDRNPDPNGNIVIRVEDGAVHVMHLDHAGHVLDEFTPESKREAFHKLYSEYRISMVSHALDIGAELQRAFDAAKTGGEYVQDHETL